MTTVLYIKTSKGHIVGGRSLDSVKEDDFKRRV